MPIEVFDFRNREDQRHVLVTPQIRARLLRIEPSSPPAEVAPVPRGGFHTHDLGHEVFLILQGRCLFEIDGEEAELGPGQMCIALVDQPHRATVIGDEPVVMYLSVTPHIRPTHTYLDEEGVSKPAVFGAPNSFEGDTDTETPFQELLNRYAETAEQAATTAADQARRAAQYRDAYAAAAELAAEDPKALEAARSEAWTDLSRSFTSIHQLGELWNDVAARTTQVLAESAEE